MRDKEVEDVSIGRNSGTAGLSNVSGQFLGSSCRGEPGKFLPQQLISLLTDHLKHHCLASLPAVFWQAFIIFLFTFLLNFSRPVETGLAC
jgi:hypothetical protein